MRNEDKARAHLQSAMKYLGFGMNSPDKKPQDDAAHGWDMKSGLYDNVDTQVWTADHRKPKSNVSRNSIITEYDRKEQEKKEAKRKQAADFAAFQASLKHHKPGGSLRSFSKAAANKKGGSAEAP